MMSWVSLLFEGVMATLMVALIVYCIKLNRRLTLLRSQDTEMAEMINGFREASERAERSAQRLKAAGLAAERSLRAAIMKAETVQSELSRSAPQPAAVKAEAFSADVPAADPRESEAGVAPPPRTPQRDMLMGVPSAVRTSNVPAKRAETREEAEQAVLEAIRTARSGAA